MTYWTVRMQEHFFTQKSMRAEFIAKRKALDKGYVLQKSHIITDKLIKSESYIKAEQIFTYVSAYNEVDTLNFIEYAIHDRKHVFIPFIKSFTQKIMCFSRLHDLSELVSKDFGILSVDNPKASQCNEKTLVIVPGVAFDKFNNRLGYGGGYYDRFLSVANPLVSVGLAYDWQIVERLDINPWDVPVNYVLTN